MLIIGKSLFERKRETPVEGENLVVFAAGLVGYTLRIEITDEQDGPMLHIYVDADSCPMKQEVYRVAGRCGLLVTLVANSPLRVPDEEWISLVVVSDAPDAADDWIAEAAEAFDIVVTADILLASRCIAAGARVVGPTGKALTENTIGDAVATRNLLAELRDSGEPIGGPPPLSKRDRSRFLQTLDETIQELRRREGPAPG